MSVFKAFAVAATLAIGSLTLADSASAQSAADVTALANQLVDILVAESDSLLAQINDPTTTPAQGNALTAQFQQLIAQISQVQAFIPQIASQPSFALPTFAEALRTLISAV